MATTIRAQSPQDLLPKDHHTCLLFDWDGTLFDNHHFNYRAMAEGLKRFHVEISEEWFLENSGYSARRIAQLAVGQAGQETPVGVVLAARDDWARENLDQVPVVNEVMSLLRAPQGRAVGIVTGSERSNIDPLIELHELPDLLDVVVTRDEISIGKPSPDGYLLAMSRLGIDEPSTVLVFEDSDQGIDAAAAAGTDVVDVRALVTGSTSMISRQLF